MCPLRNEGNRILISETKEKLVEIPLPASIRFQPSDKVRVRRGVKDVEYSDIPLGGWAGMITEIDGGMCTVKWTKETLASSTLSYRNRDIQQRGEASRFTRVNEEEFALREWMEEK